MKIFLIILSSVFFFSGAQVLALEPFRVPLGVALTSLDPSEAEDFITVRVLMNLGWGLIRLDKNLSPEPALAESWRVSSDGKKYIFK